MISSLKTQVWRKRAENYKFWSWYLQHENVTHIKRAGNAALHSYNITVVKHSASLRHKICCDLYFIENATPLSVAFRRQEAVNQCAEEAELIFKFNAAFFIAKEELPLSKYKGQLNLQRKNGMKLNSTYDNFFILYYITYIIRDVPGWLIWAFSIFWMWTHKLKTVPWYIWNWSAVLPCRCNDVSTGQNSFRPNMLRIGHAIVSD